MSLVDQQGASPIHLIGFEDDTNLREISWNQKVLERISKKWKLQHGEAVVFCNVKKDRFRLVASFYGLAVLILPPINPEDRISLYLKISLFLKQFKRTHEVVYRLGEEIVDAQERLKKRKALARKELKRRKK